MLVIKDTTGLHRFVASSRPPSPVYKTAMAGIHQAENAASAVMATKVLSEKRLYD